LEGDPSTWFFVVGLAITFLLSSFFSVIKIIFGSVDKHAISAEDERLRYYASKISTLLENRAQFSSIVSMGKTFANTGFSIFAYGLYVHLFPDAALYKKAGIPFLSALLVLTLFAHFIPRAFALRFRYSFLAFAYASYKALSWFFVPFATLFFAIHRWLLRILNYDEKFSFLSEEEKARMSETDDTEALDEEEKEMIRSIFDMGETTVDEIMVPRIDIKGLDIGSDLPTVMKIIREEGHSRIPVYKDTIDSIVGVLYAKDMITWLSENPPEKWVLSDLVKKPHFVPMAKKINDLMREFKSRHIHIAIVVDEYGGTAGIVTMEDILEEIVGDIQDEYDVEEKAIIPLGDSTYLIDPHTDLHDLNEEIGVNLELEDVDYNTLGGLIYHEYGDVPQENTEFDYDGLRITVLKMDNQRIEKVKVLVHQRPHSNGNGNH